MTKRYSGTSHRNVTHVTIGDWGPQLSRGPSMVIGGAIVELAEETFDLKSAVPAMK